MNRIAIIVESGMVQGVYADDTEISVVVIDHDGSADDPGTPSVCHEKAEPWSELDPENARLAGEDDGCPYCDDPECSFEDGICNTRLREDDERMAQAEEE